MKKLVFILLSALAVSCAQEVAPKPEHLLSEDQMVDILYDVSLLQSVKSFKPQILDSNKVDPRTYIYQKYKIDSLTLAQNHTWYATDLENYENIQKRVITRLEREKDKLMPKGSKKKKANVATPSATPALQTNDPKNKAIMERRLKDAERRSQLDKVSRE